MIRKLLIGLMLLVGAPSLTLAASFDCDKAATETEIAICSDPELSALDELAGVLGSGPVKRLDAELLSCFTIPNDLGDR